MRGYVVIVVSAIFVTMGWIAIFAQGEEVQLRSVEYSALSTVTTTSVFLSPTEAAVDIYTELQPPPEVVSNFDEADRVGNYIAGETIPVPPAPGLQGKPFAPEGLSEVEQVEFYRVQWDLPEYFGCKSWMIGWKESNCRNDVSSWCCHGIWQLWVDLHLKDHRLAPRYAECGITAISDVLGNEPIKMQRNACGAKAVLDISGCGAWDTCPF